MSGAHLLSQRECIQQKDNVPFIMKSKKYLRQRGVSFCSAALSSITITTSCGDIHRTGEDWLLLLKTSQRCSLLNSIEWFNRNSNIRCRYFRTSNLPNRSELGKHGGLIANMSIWSPTEVDPEVISHSLLLTTTNFRVCALFVLRFSIWSGRIKIGRLQRVLFRGS